MSRLFESPPGVQPPANIGIEKIMLGLALAALLMPPVAGLISGHNLVESLSRPAGLISLAGVITGIVKKNPALVGISLLALILNAAISASRQMPF